MHFKANQLVEEFPETLKWLGGNKSKSASSIATPEKAHAESLVFCTTQNQADMAAKAGAAIIVISQKIQWHADPSENGPAFFSTPSIPNAMSQLLVRMDQKSRRFEFDSDHLIHPTAFVHPLAQLAKDVVVGPFSYIGARAHLAAGVKVGPHCTVENDVRIGENCTFHSHVVIGALSQIGARCEIHSHSVLGSDGFGFTPDKKGEIQKVPQLGKVVLEDDVEIGANCAIDRATLEETRIGRNTKLDNFCHIAHNCKIGKHCMITAGFIVAGSTEIGDHFVCGGRTSVTGHVKIADRVQLGGHSVIAKNLDQPGVYGGYPIQPMKDYLRTTSSLPELPRMRRLISRIMKHLDLSEAD